MGGDGSAKCPPVSDVAFILFLTFSIEMVSSFVRTIYSISSAQIKFCFFTNTETGSNQATALSDILCYTNTDAQTANVVKNKTICTKIAA